MGSGKGRRLFTVLVLAVCRPAAPLVSCAAEVAPTPRTYGMQACFGEEEGGGFALRLVRGPDWLESTVFFPLSTDKLRVRANAGGKSLKIEGVQEFSGYLFHVPAACGEPFELTDAASWFLTSEPGRETIEPTLVLNEPIASRITDALTGARFAGRNDPHLRLLHLDVLPADSEVPLITIETDPVAPGNTRVEADDSRLASFVRTYLREARVEYGRYLVDSWLSAYVSGAANPRLPFVLSAAEEARLLDTVARTPRINVDPGVSPIEYQGEQPICVIAAGLKVLEHRSCRLGSCRAVAPDGALTDLFTDVDKDGTARPHLRSGRAALARLTGTPEQLVITLARPASLEKRFPRLIAAQHAELSLTALRLLEGGQVFAVSIGSLDSKRRGHVVFVEGMTEEGWRVQDSAVKDVAGRTRVLPRDDVLGRVNGLVFLRPGWEEAPGGDDRDEGPRVREDDPPAPDAVSAPR